LDKTNYSVTTPKGGESGYRGPTGAVALAESRGYASSDYNPGAHWGGGGGGQAEGNYDGTKRGGGGAVRIMFLGPTSTRTEIQTAAKSVPPSGITVWRNNVLV
jgi:hypothetical protein